MTIPRPAQTARYERKREAILDAAAALFNRHGLAGITLADVAQSVGLIMTSVTYYYRKKEDLAAACLMRSIATLDAMFDQAMAAPAVLICPKQQHLKLVQWWAATTKCTACGPLPSSASELPAKVAFGPVAWSRYRLRSPPPGMPE